MKHLFSTLFVILLLLLGFTASAVSDTITIGLFYGSTALDRVDLASGDGLYAGGALLGTLIYAINENGVITIYDATSGNMLYQEYGEAALVEASGNIMKVNDKRYRGTTKLVPTDGKITVISIANIDDYLCGVLPKETYASWNEEALKAQAVVSRSLVHSAFVGKHKSLGFDVCTTTNCQVYGGYDVEHANTTKAVYDTKNTIAWYNGSPAHTLFSASNGGYVEKSENVWSGSYPYLQSFKDEYEKTDEIKGCTWTVELTPQEIHDAVLKSSGKDIGTVTGMEAAGIAESGRVTLLKVYGTDGTAEFKNEKTRTLFGLKSQLYTITAPSASACVLTSDGISQLAGNSVISGDGKVTSFMQAYILCTDGMVELPKSDNSNYVISGKGYGHGVGMSQWGSMYMAEAGKTYEQIVKYYYPGVTLYTY